MSDPLATVPLSAIRVFEAAARLLSFTRAAEELGITQAAVSWQVKALERRLGQNLFRRLPREVALTPAGQRLARAASEAMASLRSAVGDITETGEGVLAITTLQTFAGQWLASRLGGFQVAHPKIAVRLETAGRVVDLLREDVDVAIRSGGGVWPDMEAVPLFPSVMTPLCVPGLAAQLGDPPEPAALLDAPRIGLGSEWAQWFEAAVVPPPSEERHAAPRLAADAQVLEVAAAMTNRGVALASPILFAPEIEAGRLVQPFDIYWAIGRGYWLVYPKDRRRARKITAFRDWLEAQVAEDAAAQRFLDRPEFSMSA